MTTNELAGITGRYVQVYLVHPAGDDSELGYETVGYPHMIRHPQTMIPETEQNRLNMHLDQCPPFGLLDVGTFTTGEYVQAFGKDPKEAPIMFMGVEITYEDRERISRDGC
jgi:hypothetical protein